VGADQKDRQKKREVLKNDWEKFKIFVDQSRYKMTGGRLRRRGGVKEVRRGKKKL